MSRTRVTIGAIVLALCLAPGAAPAALGAPSGEGLIDTGTDLQAWYGPCSFVLGTAASGGIDVQGWSSVWLFSGGPAFSPEGRAGADSSCTFDATVRFDVKSGGAPLSQRYTGGNKQQPDTTQGFLSHPDERTEIRPRDMTVTVCQQGRGCSAPHTGHG